MEEKCVIGNEDGSVLIISLVILALLLIIGMSATTTSNIENLVTRNVEEYTVALYRAEAAAMEAVQLLNDEPDLLETPPDFLHPTEDGVTDANIVDKNYWEDDPLPKVAGIDGSSKHLAQLNEVLGSLSVDVPNIYMYTAYGRGKSDRGATAIIGVGYKKAF